MALRRSDPSLGLPGTSRERFTSASRPSFGYAARPSVSYLGRAAIPPEHFLMRYSLFTGKYKQKGLICQRDTGSLAVESNGLKSCPPAEPEAWKTMYCSKRIRNGRRLMAIQDGVRRGVVVKDFLQRITDREVILNDQCCYARFSFASFKVQAFAHGFFQSGELIL